MVQFEAPAASAHVRKGHSWHAEAVGPEANVPAGQIVQLAPSSDAVLSAFVPNNDVLTTVAVKALLSEYLPKPQSVQLPSNC